MVRLRRWTYEEGDVEENGFNPTMVRLRLAYAALLHVAKSTFNPTMVRLRQLTTGGGSVRDYRFQSHYGAIAT